MATDDHPTQRNVTADEPTVTRASASHAGPALAQAAIHRSTATAAPPG